MNKNTMVGITAYLILFEIYFSTFQIKNNVMVHDWCIK